MKILSVQESAEILNSKKVEIEKFVSDADYSLLELPFHLKLNMSNFLYFFFHLTISFC
jgi:hypothetical protein